MFETSKEAKNAGWFSRRHETDREHLASKNTRREKLGNRRVKADERAEIRALRSDEKQLEILATRGVTKGREVDRLLGNPKDMK